MSLKDSISKLEQLWYSVKLPETHKLHLLFRHVIDDIKKWKGLGDKTEQNIERRHQWQSQMMDRLRTMNVTTERLCKQYEYEWRSTEPRCIEILADVLAPVRSKINKRSGELTLGEKSKVKKARIKVEKRTSAVTEVDVYLANMNVVGIGRIETDVNDANIDKEPNNENEAVEVIMIDTSDNN